MFNVVAVSADNFLGLVVTTIFRAGENPDMIGDLTFVQSLVLPGG